MEEFIKILISSIISGAVISAMIGVIFKKKTETIAAQIKNDFELIMIRKRTNYQWLEKAVIEFYGPLIFHFSRTKNAFERYHETNLFLETKVIKDSNEKIRNLLLEKSYLIPPELIQDAHELIKHYDVWLEEFYKIRELNDQKDDSTFVFAGPKGHPFPKESEKKFINKYHEIWKKLYDL